MRRSVRNLIMGLSVVAAATAGLVIPPARGTDPEEALAALEKTAPSDRVNIEYPLDETLFPPEIPAPAFRRKDGNPRSDRWLVAVEFARGRGRIAAFAAQARWKPEASVWEEIKTCSLEVNLPFVKAVRNPSNIRWRFGALPSARTPPVFLYHLSAPDRAANTPELVNAAPGISGGRQ